MSRFTAALCHARFARASGDLPHVGVGSLGWPLLPPFVRAISPFEFLRLCSASSTKGHRKGGRYPWYGVQVPEWKSNRLARIKPPICEPAFRSHTHPASLSERFL